MLSNGQSKDREAGRFNGHAYHINDPPVLPLAELPHYLGLMGTREFDAAWVPLVLDSIMLHGGSPKSLAAVLSMVRDRYRKVSDAGLLRQNRWGSDTSKSVLTSAQVRVIRRVDRSVKTTELAELMGTNHSTISRIRNGKAFKFVTS